jgi:hypothetical protein
MYGKSPLFFLNSFRGVFMTARVTRQKFSPFSLSIYKTYLLDVLDVWTGLLSSGETQSREREICKRPCAFEFCHRELDFTSRYFSGMLLGL